MKKFLAFSLCIVFCVLLASCGNEQNHLNDVSDGVPNALVLRNVSLAEHMTYDIKHNYDSATHIDDVELVIFYKGDFGLQTKTYTYAYQYDKSKDLWELIDGGEGLQSDTVALDPQAYMGKSFEGRFEGAHSGQYCIYVRNLDLSNETITIDYTIIFDDGDILSQTAETIDICSFDDGSGLGFGIEYKRSFVVRFTLYFSLNLFEGVCFSG